MTPSVKCSHCGASIQQTFICCPYCGTPVSIPRDYESFMDAIVIASRALEDKLATRKLTGTDGEKLAEAFVPLCNHAPEFTGRINYAIRTIQHSCPKAFQLEELFNEKGVEVDDLINEKEFDKKLGKGAYLDYRVNLKACADSCRELRDILSKCTDIAHSQR